MTATVSIIIRRVLMEKPTFRLLLMIVAAAVFLGSNAPALAKPPAIQIDLNFDKRSYRYGEPIGVEVVVHNESGKDILISKGFSSKVYSLEMRVIDPAGRLLLATRDEPHDEFPDAPPLAFALYEGRPIRVAACEVLPAGSKEVSRTEDLRAYYALALPGKYSAQVQISAMIFKGEPCNVNDYAWLGVLKSETKSFYVQKPTKMKVRLDQWRHQRKARDKKTPDVQVRILPCVGKVVGWMDSRDIFDVVHDDSRPNPTRSDIHMYDVSTGIKSAAAPAPVLSTAKLSPAGSRNPKKGIVAEMTIPTDGATDVSVNTDIEIEISGADLKTVVMEVQGVTVYDGANPGAYPNNPIVTGSDRSGYTLTYDPPENFDSCQKVDVTVNASNKKGDTTATFKFGFKTSPPSQDDDGDCIPNDTENTILHTDPSKKTLFVRPKEEISLGQYQYWEGFVQLFPHPDPTKTWLADIPAFTNAGIEIVVIGAPGHYYSAMDSFDYDPVTDQNPNKPPCDILEIIHKKSEAYCTYGHHNYGHTYFYANGPTWYWDTKGYVPNDQTTMHYQEYDYFTPLIYPFPLNNYFTEGAYQTIQVGQGPVVPSPCSISPINQCYEFNNCSPMNLNLNDPQPNPPYVLKPDQTVEFNGITFDQATQVITYVEATEAQYDRETVLRRTIVHEMGHALLAAHEDDHCENPQCIMFGGVVDWGKRDFGNSGTTQYCTHKNDIPTRVHNSVH